MICTLYLVVLFFGLKKYICFTIFLDFYLFWFLFQDCSQWSPVNSLIGSSGQRLARQCFCAFLIYRLYQQNIASCCSNCTSFINYQDWTSFFKYCAFTHSPCHYSSLAAPCYSLTACNAVPPLKSKIAARGFKNGRQDLQWDLFLNYWALWKFC